MVNNAFPKAKNEIYSASGFFGHMQGDPDRLDICTPLLVDDKGAYFVPTSLNWENKSISGSVDPKAKPMFSVFNTETLAELTHMRAPESHMPHQYANLISMSPPKPILQGQNMVQIGPKLLERAALLSPDLSDVLLSNSFELFNEFRGKFMNENQYSMLVDDITTAAFYAFDEEVTPESKVLTERAKAAVAIFDVIETEDSESLLKKAGCMRNIPESLNNSYYETLANHFEYQYKKSFSSKRENPIVLNIYK